MIIGMSGYRGHGKDTVADILVNDYGFTKLSFASALKDVVAQLFNWDRVALDGLTEDARKWRETVDVFWADNLGVPDFTPIWALEHIGTEALRNQISQNIWTTILKDRILTNYKDKDVVITDVRFVNEYNMVKELGGVSVVVDNGQYPEWHYDILSYVRGEDEYGNKDPDGLAKALHFMPEIHPSKYTFLSFASDVTLYNTGTIEDLKELVPDFLKKLKE